MRRRRTRLRAAPLAAKLAGHDGKAPIDAPSDKPKVRIRLLSGSGTQILQGIISSLDPNAELRGSLWYGSPGQLGIAARMMREAHVRQAINNRTEPLCGATWRFRPASKEPLEREAADWCRFCFLELLPWELLVKRIVGGYRVYGASLNEMTDDFAEVPRGRFPLHPGKGRGVVPTGVHEIPMNTLRKWQQSKATPSQISGIEQYLSGSDAEEMGARPVSADRILRWTLDQEGANFEGLSQNRTAYPAWKMKVAFRIISAIKHERRGVGTPVVIAGEQANDSELDAVESALAAMRSNAKGELVLPNGWSFAWEGGSQNDETNIEAAISACDTEIAVNASAGFMRLGLTGPGSYALGSTQQGAYHLAVASDARFFATGWNLGYDGWSPIERIVRMNYGPDVGIPILEARNLPTSNWSERIPLLINATNVGLITPDDETEDALREALEFDPHNPETAHKRPAVSSFPMVKTARDNQAPPAADPTEEDSAALKKKMSPVDDEDPADQTAPPK
jgi:hypothetical protein